jgi:hypothetical protein
LREALECGVDGDEKEEKRKIRDYNTSKTGSSRGVAGDMMGSEREGVGREKEGSQM